MLQSDQCLSLQHFSLLRLSAVENYSLSKPIDSENTKNKDRQLESRTTNHRSQFGFAAVPLRAISRTGMHSHFVSQLDRA